MAAALPDIEKLQKLQNFAFFRVPLQFLHMQIIFRLTFFIPKDAPFQGLSNGELKFYIGEKYKKLLQVKVVTVVHSKYLRTPNVIFKVK